MQAVVEAKAAENARQQRVLQTLRVKNILYNARIHALFIMTKMSQSSNGPKRNVCRQQRELQALRVRTYWYKFVFVTLVSSIPARVHKPFIR